MCIRDRDNDDWACDEVFTTRDQPFVIECESDWELVETFFISLVNEYLSSEMCIRDRVKPCGQAGRLPKCD